MDTWNREECNRRGSEASAEAIDMNRPNLLPVGGLPIIAIRTERLVHRDGAE